MVRVPVGILQVNSVQDRNISGGSPFLRNTTPQHAENPGPEIIGGDLALRVYAIDNCDTVVNLVPLVKQAGMKVLPTVDVTTDTIFKKEKQVLLDVIGTHGCNWVAGAVVVGDDTLVSVQDTDDPENPPQETITLASRINEIKDALKKPCFSSDVWITHAEQMDQWNTNKLQPILDTVDVIGVNAITVTKDTKDAVTKIKKALEDFQSFVSQEEIWITETGWPSSGSGLSTDEAYNWWRIANCGPYALFAEYKQFWHEAFDDLAASAKDHPHLGVATADRKLKFDLTC